MEHSIYRVGALIESAKGTSLEGLLIAEPSPGSFDVLWSDGITYPAIKRHYLEGNKILRYLTEKESLAWQLRYV
jgi:hypothetical protein